MKDSIGQRIKDYWAVQTLRLRPGATLDAIQAFEQKYSVHFPSDLRDYFLTIDGLHDSDNEGFAFWPLSQLKKVTEESPSYSNFDEAGSYYVFADYLIWSWAYAIRLSRDSSEDNTVIGIGWESPKRMARSFSEFIELYFVDHPILYGVRDKDA